MPYSGPNDPKLPDNIQDLPEDDRAQWVEVFNSAYESCIDDGGAADDCESGAFAQANGVVLEIGEHMNWIERLTQRIRRVIEQENPAPALRAMAMGRIADQLWNALYEVDAETGSWNWPVDIYVDDDGALFAIIARDGMLFRVELDLSGDTLTLGEWMQVTEVFEPVQQKRRSIVLRKQSDGRIRFYCVACTAVLNRIGQIDSTAAFDSYVAYANENNRYPEFWFYHAGEQFRLGEGDWVGRDGVTYLVSGLFDQGNPLAEAAIRAILREPDYWGISIGFQPFSDPTMVEVAAGVEIPVYTDGMNFELSLLPEAEAAALFTGIAIRTEEMAVMNERMRAALERLFGEDAEGLEAFVATVDDVNRSVEENGLIFRNRRGAAEDDNQTPDDEQNSDEDGDGGAPDNELEPEIQLDDAAVTALSRAILEQPQFQTLSEAVTRLVSQTDEQHQTVLERLTQLEEITVAQARRIEALERDDDEKRREWAEDLPQARATRVTYRPREAHAAPDADAGHKPETMEDRANRTLAKVKPAALQNQ